VLRKSSSPDACQAPGRRHRLYIMGELCEGVHFAHELAGRTATHRLVHRDISPDNVLLSYAGE